jgi:histone H3/H4
MIQDEGDYNIQETGLKMDGDQQGKTEEMVEATVMGQENFIDSVSGVEVIRMEGQDEEENLDADGRDLYATTEINGEKDDEDQNDEDNKMDTDAPPSSTKKKRKRRSSSTPVRSKVASDNDAIPNAKDLFVPFRVIKRIMKIDKDIGTVQNEAAMVATYALELFIENMMKESHENAIKRGRNTVK